MAFGRSLLAALLLACSVGPAAANIKKAIFLGPEAVTVPVAHPTLDDLGLDVLTPDDWVLRTHLRAEFPRNASDRGRPSWLLLDGLAPGRRYEVRVCWAATQPTEFDLELHELDAVWSTPELVSSLSDYSYERLQDPGLAPRKASRGPGAGERKASVLLLQIFAAADYFSLNRTLMEAIPPVYADVILDPYLFNLVPRTLLVPIGYIAVVVVVSACLGRVVAGWLRAAAAPDALPDDKKDR